MDAVIERLEAHAERMVPNRAVSTQVNPEPLRGLIAELARALDLTQLSLLYYHHLAELRRRGQPDRPALLVAWSPPAPWRQSPDSAPSEPWRSLTSQNWLDAQERVRLVLLNHYETLKIHYANYAGMLRGEVARDYRASELAYTLCARIEMCSYACRTVEQKSLMCRALATDVEVARRLELAMSETEPVLAYRCSTALAAMRRFATRCSFVSYEPELERYWELLEHRLQRLMLYASTEIDHDMPSMRTAPKRSEGRTVELYAANPLYITTLTVTSCALHRKFLYSRYLPWRAPVPYEGEKQMAEAVRAWLARRGSASATSCTADSVRDRTVASSIAPGEREMYRIDNPREDDSDLSILSKNRGDSFKHVIDATEASVDVIISLGLRETQSPDSLESFPFQYAVLDLCEQACRTMCCGMEWFEHASLEADLELQLEDLRRTDRPRVTQVFNHWQLCFRKETFAYNSIVRALAAFFYYTYRYFAGHLSRRITLDEWANEMFGQEILHRYLARPEFRPAASAPSVEQRAIALERNAVPRTSLFSM